MRFPTVISCSLLLMSFGGLGQLTANAGDLTPAERGRQIILHQSLNPAVWSLSAYDNLWKTWGLKEKPADYAEAVKRRYGLSTAPFDNHGLPLGLMQGKLLLGKGIVNNCLLCHGGTVAGQTIIGLGNSALDLQGLFEDLGKADNFVLQFPFRFSYVRGSIDPLNPLIYLMEFRDYELNVKQSTKLGYGGNVSSDPPAWWLIKRKKTRDWTGGIDARSTRVDMANLLTPLNSGDYVRKQEEAFVGIEAFVRSIEAPRYPFTVDTHKAERGRALFVETCARCHGSYGPGGTYPNKIVPFDEIGTDRVLGDALRPELAEHFNKSWLAREIGPDGKPYRFIDPKGYQAPPLDGIWATAPYFHNSSAPTVYQVLNSKARPKYFTRSYGTAKEDYDQVKLGLKITVLDAEPSSSLSGFELRKIYDTTRPGLANTGHTYGDDFTDEERLEVIEYLKTL
jgi:mono/diheme cytochrome c family protein